MCSYYKTVEELIENWRPIQSYLKDADSFWAHRPRNENENIQPELLSDHIKLVDSYFVKIVDRNRIDFIIDTLIDSFLKENNADNELARYIKQLFVDVIIFHDFGKVNENFQENKDKMNNPSFKGKGVANSPISTKHSSLGAFIYLYKHLNDIQKNYTSKEYPILFGCCFIFSYSIFKHHARYINDEYVDTICFTSDLIQNKIEEYKEFLKRYVSKYGFPYCETTDSLIGDKYVFEILSDNNLFNSFSLYALCRLNFSLLTAADYLATNQYMNQLPISDFGTLTKERINEIYANVSEKEWIDEVAEKKNYNKTTYAILDNYDFTHPQEKSGDDLNVLRTEMAVEVIRNIRKNYQNNLFFIEAPTGGGKTNLSILATIELLKIYEGQYNKVFYVFPFTTLITQTYAAVRDALGLREEEIIELHSKAGMKNDTATEDDQYGKEKLNYINNLFVNYPFCLLSHIRFFDILKTNEKETNYLLHRLVNSVVVIDELQSYNPAQWDKVIYFIRQYAEKFNIKFILMSATLPKLDKLKVIKQQVNDFVYLLPDAKANYFNNPNFSGRVQFNFDLFDRNDITLDELAAKVVDASREYLSYDFGKAKPLESVYTIVEFIYKQAATDFYDIIASYDFFDKIFVLSGTILEHRRKEIINYLKNPENRKKKIILITTQVVEAGVDIDMDLGFKDRSIIDSDEQLAGRINRNVNKEHCTLYLFNYSKDKKTVIYGKDNRYQITEEQIKADEYKRILEQKDFDALYDKIFDKRNKWNSMEMVENFSEYENAIHQLKFKSVHEKFKLIEQKNISCFIPLNVPVSVKSAQAGKPDEIFTASELDFLAQNGIYPNEKQEISGEQVFDLYLDSIHDKVEFTQQQIRKKVLQSLLSKYVFSIFANKKMECKLVAFSDVEKSEYGYQYIQRWPDVYSVERGLDANKLVGIEESQFL
ncbi:MAG: CRISPR-associated helicase Cas3' [Chitinophagaceae bacterium]